MGWIKLDIDWCSDPKILGFRDQYGKAALVDVVNLFCALSEFEGKIDLSVPSQRLFLERTVGKTGKGIRTFLDRCASADLIKRGCYEAFGLVASERSMRDGVKRKRRREAAVDAGVASGEARRQKT